MIWQIPTKATGKQKYTDTDRLINTVTMRIFQTKSSGKFVVSENDQSSTDSDPEVNKIYPSSSLSNQKNTISSYHLIMLTLLQRILLTTVHLIYNNSDKTIWL